MAPVNFKSNVVDQILPIKNLDVGSKFWSNNLVEVSNILERKLFKSPKRHKIAIDFFYLIYCSMPKPWRTWYFILWQFNNSLAIFLSHFLHFENFLAKFVNRRLSGLIWKLYSFWVRFCVGWKWKTSADFLFLFNISSST